MNNISYQNLKVLIFGLGTNQGGLGSALFFASQGAQVRVTDLKQADALQESLDQLKTYPNISYILGEHRYEDIDWADLIIKNQAVKPENPYMEYALQKEKVIKTDIGIFLEHVDPSQLIGVTGTKGKSTTSTMIYEILRLAGKKVLFGGNIGKSVLNMIPLLEPDTLIVLELSSFQLEAFESHQLAPRWSVITNIYPDHLNYYKTMEAYTEAKKVIAKYQRISDFLFLRQDDPVTNSPRFLEDLRSKIIYFSPHDLPDDFKPKLPGEHNLYNFAAAFQVAKHLGIDETFAQEAMENFAGVEYRLQLIKEFQGVKIYNDSAATNPEAAVQALKCLPHSILIAGGVNKNLPYNSLGDAIDELAKAVFLLEGDATEELKKHIADKSKIKDEYDDLKKLLEDVREYAKPDDIILFSPGAASFNLFKNEFDRGMLFNQTVEQVFV